VANAVAFCAPCTYPGMVSAARFARFVWMVFAYNLLVVVWGGYVRASSSGAGCGSHWPLCNGEIVPTQPSVKTLVELSHRATSGIALLLVVVMTVLAFRVFAKGSLVRKFAVITLVLMLSEALIGAGLVLFELVAHNASMKRALSMALHMSNTFLLLAFMACTALAASGHVLRLRRALGGARSMAVVVSVLLAGLTGAVAALGDTLFPASSLRAGFAEDMNLAAHWLVRVRSLHPAIAVAAAVLAVLHAGRLTSNAGSGSMPTTAPYRTSAAGSPAGSLSHSLAHRAGVAIFVLVGAQVAVGLLNLLMLAPTSLQLVHLVLADLVFVSVFVSVCAEPDAAALETPAATMDMKTP
jgi:heme a synthase